MHIIIKFLVSRSKIPLIASVSRFNTLDDKGERVHLCPGLCFIEISDRLEI